MPSATESDAPPGDKRHFGMVRKTSQPDLECVWQETIVRIEEHDELAGDVLEAFVACRALALVGLRDTTDRLVRSGHFDGAVRRTIVNDDDLGTRIGLSQNAFDRLAEKSRLVVTGNDDTETRSEAGRMVRGDSCLNPCFWRVAVQKAPAFARRDQMLHPDLGPGQHPVQSVLQLGLDARVSRANGAARRRAVCRSRSNATRSTSRGCKNACADTWSSDVLWARDGAVRRAAPTSLVLLSASSAWMTSVSSHPISLPGRYPRSGSYGWLDCSRARTHIVGAPGMTCGESGIGSDPKSRAAYTPAIEG